VLILLHKTFTLEKLDSSIIIGYDGSKPSTTTEPEPCMFLTGIRILNLCFLATAAKPSKRAHVELEAELDRKLQEAGAVSDGEIDEAMEEVLPASLSSISKRAPPPPQAEEEEEEEEEIPLQLTTKITKPVVSPPKPKPKPVAAKTPRPSVLASKPKPVPPPLPLDPPAQNVPSPKPPVAKAKATAATAGPPRKKKLIQQPTPKPNPSVAEVEDFSISLPTKKNSNPIASKPAKRPRVASPPPSKPPPPQSSPGLALPGMGAAVSRPPPVTLPGALLPPSTSQTQASAQPSAVIEMEEDDDDEWETVVTVEPVAAASTLVPAPIQAQPVSSPPESGGIDEYDIFGSEHENENEHDDLEEMITADLRMDVDEGDTYEHDPDEEDLDGGEDFLADAFDEAPPSAVIPQSNGPISLSRMMGDSVDSGSDDYSSTDDE
jgi:hypothetical protein